MTAKLDMDDQSYGVIHLKRREGQDHDWSPGNGPRVAPEYWGWIDGARDWSSALIL